MSAKETIPKITTCGQCDYWQCEVCCNGYSPKCAEYTGRLDGCQYGEAQKPLPAEAARGVYNCPRCCAPLPDAKNMPDGGHIVCHDCGAMAILNKQQ